MNDKNDSQDEVDISTKRELKKNSLGKRKKKKGKKSTKKEKVKKVRDEMRDENDSKFISELEESYENREDSEECYSHLKDFYNNLNTINLDNLITKKNIKFFQDINPKENIQIDLLLSKIYGKILSSEDFYKDYFSDEDENEKKMPLIFSFIEEAIKIIDNFADNFISLENFKLKENLLKLIKFIYINLKDSVTDEEEENLSKLIEELPPNFYSENYLELIKLKNIIYQNNNELMKNIEKIDNLFFELGSYYEQLNCIKLLLNDIETDDSEKQNNFTSVTLKDIKKKNKKVKKTKIEDDEEDETTLSSSKKKNKIEYTDEEIILYGQFLLKICIYQKFHLKNKKIEKQSKRSRKSKNVEEQEEEEIGGEEVEDDEEGEEEEDEEEEKEQEDKKNKKNTKVSKIKNKNGKKTEIVKSDKNTRNSKIKKNKKEKEDNDEEDSEEDDPKNVLSLFVIDAVKNVKGRIQNKSNENIEIEELLDEKYCISLYERENLFEIIKKNIKNFQKLTKKSKNKTIKSLNEKLNLYISAINDDKYIPINIDEINNIKYYSNFSKNTIVVPNRDSRILYVENNEDQKGLLLIEFYLTEENKDIIFRINRHDPTLDEFKEIYDTGKLNKKCKLSVYFEEKSLYQIEFDNKYSWINSKEINFTISLFKIIDEDKIIEEINEDNKEENSINTEVKKVNNENNENNENNNININEIEVDENETNKKNKKTENKKYKESKISDHILNNTKQIKFYCNNEDQNYTFNCNKIYKKIISYQELEKQNLIQNNGITISILVNLNQIRIITFDNNEKMIYTEIIDEKEKILTKSFFNKSILKYLKDNYKIEKNNNKVLINLYSQNKNLSLESNKIKELINALKDYSINNVDQKQNHIYSQFLQKLGFYPDKKMGEFEIMYNLYDFSDQCLIYHLFLVHCKEKFIESSTLVMIFDKNILHITAMNEGGIYKKFKSLENSWKHKYYSKLKMDDFKSLVDFISAISDTFDGLDLVLCYMNNDDKKEDLLALFKQIQEYTSEKIDEPINVYIYKEEELINKTIKYIGLFSDE